MNNAQSKNAIPKKSQTQVEWFKCSISKKELRGYMKRQNRIPLIWLAGHFCLIVAAGISAWSSLGALYFWPVFFVYATAYSFLECLMRYGSFSPAHHRQQEFEIPQAQYSTVAADVRSETRDQRRE